MIKVLDAWWYTPFTTEIPVIGIVKVKTEREVKFYIGTGYGHDEEEDIERILKYGDRFYPGIFGGKNEKTSS